MDDNNLVYIEAYHNASLSDAERSVFEQKLVTDRKLKQDYEDYRALLGGFKSIEMSKTEEMLRSLPSADKKPATNVININLKRSLSLAASIIFIVATFYLTRSGTTHEYPTITAQYVVEPVSDMVRGVDHNTLFNDAIVLYKRGDYKQALTSLTNLPTSHTADQALLSYWKGHSYYKLENYNQAAASFLNISTDAQDDIAQDAHWMYILSVINDTDSDINFRNLLIEIADQNQGQYSRLAKRLLEEL